MTKILAFSGKKQSGKNTLCNFMHGYFLKANNIINAFDLTTEGDLIVETLVRFEDGDKMHLVPMDVTRTDIEFAIWAMDSVWPYIKHYAFATALKEVLIGLFEAPRENMYGTDEQKNALSEIMSLVESLAQTPRPKPVGTARRMEESVLSKSIKETAEQIKEKARQAQQKRSPLKLAPQVSAEASEKIQQLFAPENKTIIDKIEGLKDRFWQRMAQGIADQYRSIKEYSKTGYEQARLSKSVDGGLEGLMFYGEVFNDGGALNIRKGSQGLIKILEPVGTEVDNFMIWMALNREEQLRKAGKTPSISDEILAEKDTLSSGTLNGQSRLQVYNRVREDMNKLNRSVLDVAREAGLIDEKSYTRFSEDNFYVPFYKEMEGKDIDAPSIASGLTSQYFSKQLKGGERPFGDLVENTLRNWNHILSAAMKNQAAVTTIKDASDFKLGDTPVVEPTTEQTGAAKVMIDGKAQYFKINDPLLFDSISAIGYLGPKYKFVDVLRDFKNLLQFGVTLSPAFKVNNVIRDSLSSLSVSELSKDSVASPVYNVLNGVSIFNKKDDTYISALAGGGIFTFGTAYEGDQSKMIKRLIEKGISEGLGARDIARTIRKDTGFNRNRSLNIARTETITSANQGKYLAASSSPYVKQKKWLPTIDARTRATHRAMTDAPYVDLTQDFFLQNMQTGSLEAAQYPCDTRLSAGNTCNCRCIIIFKNKLLTPLNIGGIIVHFTLCDQYLGESLLGLGS